MASDEYYDALDKMTPEELRTEARRVGVDSTVLAQLDEPDFDGDYVQGAILARCDDIERRDLLIERLSRMCRLAELNAPVVVLQREHLLVAQAILGADPKDIAEVVLNMQTHLDEYKRRV